MYHAFELAHYTHDIADSSHNDLDEIILNERLSPAPITITVTAKVVSRPVQMSGNNYMWKSVDLEVQQYLARTLHVFLYNFLV